MNTPRTAGLIISPCEMEFVDELIPPIVAAPPPFNEVALPAQGTILPIFRRERRCLPVA